MTGVDGRHRSLFVSHRALLIEDAGRGSEAIPPVSRLLFSQPDKIKFRHVRVFSADSN
jgi:hypothetical protein